jgi:N-acetylglucosaminyldiphosphoundecaprenol N-acetyl-beta-D-mannosaminyltransferase
MFGMDFHSAENHQKVLDFFRSHDRVPAGNLPFLITPNVDQIVKLHKSENQDLLIQLEKSCIILPDGQPIVWASKLKFGSSGLENRLTGSDLFPKLWADLKKNSKKVFFILPKENLGKAFQTEYSNCRFYAPPMFSIKEEIKYSSVIEHCCSEIRAFKPDHVMIGLGFPKQEHLAIAIHKEVGGSSIFYHLLGASFEFYLGEKKRAPTWMQKMGLEFIHRLISEPRRMIKRYLIDDLAFFPLFVKELRRPK